MLRLFTILFSVSALFFSLGLEGAERERASSPSAADLSAQSQAAHDPAVVADYLLFRAEAELKLFEAGYVLPGFDPFEPEPPQIPYSYGSELQS